MMQFYSSSNSVVNSKRAMAECIENALEGQSNLDCDLIIFYTTMGHNFKDLLSEARRLSPKAEVVGCTGSGVIGREGPNESMRALAIMAIKGEKDKFAVAARESLIDSGSFDSFEKSAEMARELRDKASGITMIHFLPSIDMVPERAIEGFEAVFGPGVTLFGAVSSDNIKQITSFQFYNDRVLERGAVAVGFADPEIEIITRANHGFEIIGSSFEVTKADFPYILELNGQPAWGFITDRLGFPKTAQWVEVSPVVQLAEKLPPTLHEEYGSEYILRVFMATEGDDRIFTPFHDFCRKGKELWLGKRDEQGMFKGVDHLLKQIVEDCEGRKPLAVFQADCALRGRLSFNQVLKDEILNRIQYPLSKDKDIPWLGIYGNGEFTRLGGQNRIHFYTTSLYVILERAGKREVKKV
jgi:hypothetical protein